MSSIITGIVDWLTTPYTIFLVLKDPAIPAGVKWRAVIGLAAIFAYVISPVDIVPDVVPLSGWLDDLIVVPLGFALLRKLTPGIDVVERRERAQKSVKKVVFRTLLALAVAVFLGLVWLGLLVFITVKLITG